MVINTVITVYIYILKKNYYFFWTPLTSSPLVIMQCFTPGLQTWSQRCCWVEQLSRHTGPLWRQNARVHLPAHIGPYGSSYMQTNRQHTHKIMQHVNHYIVMPPHHSLWTMLVCLNRALLPPMFNPKKLTVIFVDNTFAGNNFYNVRLSKCQLIGKPWPHLKAGMCTCICKVQLSRVPT